MSTEFKTSSTPSNSSREDIAQRLRLFIDERHKNASRAAFAKTCSTFFDDSEETSLFNREAPYLINLLASCADQQDRPLAKDLSVMGRLFATLAESVEEEILTPEEAEALIELVLAGFISRRFYKTLRGIANPGRSHWCLATLHQHGK